jgi:hypothetical protein
MRPADMEAGRRLGFCADSLARSRSADPVTLDGAPALIRGAFKRFADVARADGKGGDVSYSWSAVASVMAKGGAFKS